MASWIVAIMTKMVNMTKIGKEAINDENRQRAGGNFNKITKGAPYKEEKLTECMVNLQKW